MGVPRAVFGGKNLKQFDPAASAAVPAGALSPKAGQTGGDALLAVVLASLEDDKAEEIATIPLAGKSEMGDHMVIATGRSSRQVASIAEKLADRLKAVGVPVRTEGRELGDWVLLDAGDVIVHVFRPEVREFYQLEKMWASDGALPRPSTSV